MDDHDWGFVAGMDDDGADAPADAEASAGDGPAAPADGRPGERVYAFPVGDAYALRHYFEGDAAFGLLEPYYDQRRYRFVVPAEEFPELRTALATEGYRLSVVEDPTRFAVAVEKYTDHPDVVFEERVFQVDAGDATVFVLADEAAVHAAVAAGATRLADADLAVRLPGGADRGPTADARAERRADATPR